MECGGIKVKVEASLINKSGVNLDGYATDKWPSSSLLFTGSSLILDFQTASNYLNVEDPASRFGFACTVTGYPNIRCSFSICDPSSSCSFFA